MREIKFRAWRKETGKMYSWEHMCTGYLQGYLTGYYPGLELMQFTGLCDKNGVEIYESDIVKISIEQYGRDGSTKDYRIIRGSVEWSHMGFDIKIGTHDGKPVYSDIIQEMHLTDNIISDEWEVIGNIHEGVKE